MDRASVSPSVPGTGKGERRRIEVIRQLRRLSTRREISDFALIIWAIAAIVRGIARLPVSDPLKAKLPAAFA
jgi:hypothetical protein